ncbi:hypothetical protein KSP40_PGU002734 [Platanthera guangdongensis]|uniref:Uncharacterized protein n=1 Tax=Platanthera guangdongensis TaxID=2320717 RepID=A0ABR2MIL8_9ASPA
MLHSLDRSRQRPLTNIQPYPMIQSDAHACELKIEICGNPSSTKTLKIHRLKFSWPPLAVTAKKQGLAGILESREGQS